MASAWGNAFGSAWGNSWGAQSTPTVTTVRGGDDVPRRNPNRGWNKEEWKRLRKDPFDAIEATLRQAYKELTEGPPPVVAKVEAIVRPVAKAQRGHEPSINWTALAGQYERANALYKLWQEEQDLQAAMDEDDAIMMLL